MDFNVNNLNKQTTEYSLADLVELQRKDIMLGLYAHLPGRISSFNAATQTASVTINMKQVFYEEDPITKRERPVLKDYPRLDDVPVMFLGGSGSTTDAHRLTFPIAAGDECILLVCDRDIDAWFAGNNSTFPPSSRLHSLADAIALVGLRSRVSALKNFETDAVVLGQGQYVFRAKKTYSEIASAKVFMRAKEQKAAIFNDKQSLITVIEELITNVKALVTASKALADATAAMTFAYVPSGGPVTGPNNVAAINSAGTQINNVTSNINTTLSHFKELLDAN